MPGALAMEHGSKKEAAPGALRTEAQSKDFDINSATCAAGWEYRALRSCGRYLVVSPLGIAIEDCAAASSAARLAAEWNSRGGLGARA